MSNPVTNIEIASEESKALSKFYSDVFDWEMHSYEEGFYWFETGSEDAKGIEGHIYPPNDEMQLVEGVPFGNSVTIYVTVENIQATVDKLVNLGGKILMHPTVVSEKGEMIGMFLDPSGNRIGLYDSNQRKGDLHNG